MPDNPSATITGFREFLVSKADEFGVRDRHRRRHEWLLAVGKLIENVRTWLADADPEGLLDVQSYPMSRTEATLGTYDVPALRINFGPGSVDVLPIDRYISSSSSRLVSPLIGEPAGRVDLTDGYRKVPLYRETQPGGDRWRFVDEQGSVRDLDEESFVRIVQDLLS